MANVSVASVSRALKNEPSSKLSEKQRKHILDICAQMQYYPNEHTRRLFSGSSNTVAFFFPDFGGRQEGKFLDAYTYIDINFGSCLIGAQSALRSHGMDLLLTEVTAEFIETKRYLNLIRGKLFDGILIWGAINGEEYVREVLAEGIPTVMIQTVDDDCRCSSVISDEYDGMRQLAEKVLASGHRRIAIAGAKTFASSIRNRMNGIVETLRKHNVEEIYISCQEGLGYYHGEKAVREILDKAPRTTCIMALSDTSAYGCIDELKKHNISVPEDISVTGADGLNLPGHPIRLNTFFLPSFEIGRQGAELLFEEISGNPEIKKYCLPVKEVAGETLTKIKNLSV